MGIFGEIEMQWQFKHQKLFGQSDDIIEAADEFRQLNDIASRR